MIRELIIVEDDFSTRRSLVRWAKVNGYAALAFPSATAFLECDLYAKEACLILDLGLPGMSGDELLHHLQSEQRAMPTVVISALPEQDIAAALRGLESIPVLRKPFEEAALAAALASLRTSSEPTP